MKTKMILLILTILLLLILNIGCKKEVVLPLKYYSCQCENGVLIKILKDEPAHVKYNNSFETVSIELVDKNNISIVLIPCNNSLPEKYRIEGIPVFVSGEVINCMTSSPNDKIYPYYYINLSTIKNRR